jgi:hypothetical protein
MMKRNVLIIGMLAISAPCFAITPTTGPAAARGATPPISADPQTAAATRDDSSGLRKGTLEAVSVGGGTFDVYGQRLMFDPKQVKVYGRDGKLTSLYALRKGSTIRFTLDATDPLHRRVAVIYLD